MSEPFLRAVLLATCLTGLVGCTSVRTAVDSVSVASPILLGPVRALGTSPAAREPSSTTTPSAEPIEISASYSEGAVVSLFGPHWERGERPTAYRQRLQARPGLPARVRDLRCSSFRIYALLVFHSQLWCTAEADFEDAGTP